MTEWAQGLPSDAAILLPTASKISLLRSLLRHWEEETGEVVSYWAGTLWDVPIVSQFLKRLREEAQITVLEAIEKERQRLATQKTLYYERDGEALRCLSEMLSPEEKTLPLKTWRELVNLCRTTPLEWGQFPWPCRVMTEEDLPPEGISSVWWLHGVREGWSTETLQRLAWVQEISQVTITAAERDDLGRPLRPLTTEQASFGGSTGSPRTDSEPLILSLSKDRPELVEGQDPCPDSPCLNGFKVPSRRKQWEAWCDAHLFSVTELETYRCSPYAYFAERILKLRSDREETHELEPAEMGTLIHRLLEVFFRTYQKDFEECVVGTQEIESLWGPLDSLIAKEIDRIQQERSGLAPLLLQRQQERIQRVLQQLLLKDKKDMKERSNRLRPAYFEWAFGMDGSPPLELATQEGPIRLRGRIDRIDVDPERKTFLVIDYKTGSRRTTGATIERGEALQLPLYIRAVQENLLPDHAPLGGVIYSLHDLSKKDGLLRLDRAKDYFEISMRSSSLVPPQQWDEIMEQSLQQVAETVTSIRRAEFPPIEDQCRSFCSVQEICRCRCN